MTLPPYAELIRNIPDFPIPGIQFKDITPLLADSSAFAAVVDDLATPYASEQIDIVAGVEARGYIFSAPIAIKLRRGTRPDQKTRQTSSHRRRGRIQPRIWHQSAPDSPGCHSTGRTGAPGR